LDAKEQIIVNGGSMRQFLRHGQRLLICRVPEDRLRVGDLAVFRHPGHGRALVHRIRRKRMVGGKTQLLMRGDNNIHYDGWVDSGWVDGVAVKRLRAGETEIGSLENRLALLVSPLAARLRVLVISVLAFSMRFLYPYVRLDKLRSVDAGGVGCIEYFWHGWAVCRGRSSGQSWVHPVFARTGVLKKIMREFE